MVLEVSESEHAKPMMYDTSSSAENQDAESSGWAKDEINAISVLFDRPMRQKPANQRALFDRPTRQKPANKTRLPIADVVLGAEADACRAAVVPQRPGPRFGHPGTGVLRPAQGGACGGPVR
jgi:hypothetical protein